MAIYAEEYQRQPNESFYDYLMRMNQLRASGMLGNYRETQGAMPTGGTGPSPVSDPLGQQTVREITDAQRAAMAQRDSGGDEYMPERDTPEAQAARRQAALDKQIKVALGMDVTTNADITRGLGVINPLLGGFGYVADVYEKDVAALALGRALGIEDVQRAKELGYTYLDNPVQLKSLVDSGRIALTEEKPKKTMIESLFGLGRDDDGAPVYQSIAEMRQAEERAKVAPIANLINSSGGMFTDTEDNDGSSIGYVPPSQQPKTSPGAGRGGFNPTVVQQEDNSDNSPTGGGTSLSDIQGTTDYANANQDAAYEAMGGFYS